MIERERYNLCSLYAEMWRKAVFSTSFRAFSSSSTTEIPTLYSFLQPSIFALRPNEQSKQTQDSTNSQTKTLTEDQKNTLETTLEKSLVTQNIDEAWKSFKILTACCSFPSKPLTNSLITHLSSLKDTQNLKRAFASVVFVIEKDPKLLSFETVTTLLSSMSVANTAAPAFALVKCMFKNRYFVPFGLWGNILVDISRKSGRLVAFLRVFEESCRIAIDERLNYLKPDLAACNAALECCCYELESVSDAEKVVATMSVLGIRPDESSFGFLSYLFALKGLEKKIDELENLMSEFGFSNKQVLYNSLIGGYVKSGYIDLVSATILRSLREGNGKDLHFNDETFCQVVKGYIQNGVVKSLARLIIEAQKLEFHVLEVDKSIGYGIISACINLGLSDKAHSVVDEMNAQGGSVGLGVYVPILKAYSKDLRTAEATQLVMDISTSGLQLDAGMYDMLIEASMTSQDFPSAFTLFRDMRDARIHDLKGSYLTIMTGLMENQRPELMAAFLDEVVEDPRIEIKTHDWNSIIHAFCKAGRLEDARRTFRRMTFLQFEPNDQTYLSLINGYVTAEKYFSVLMLWNEIKWKISGDKGKGIKFDHNLVDAFLYALVKGGFFDAVMQVVERSQEMKIFVDKWRYKQAFMEKHKKLKVSKLRRRSFRKMEALIAFKNWAGLNA
ncbi:Pentatricopeptide repeat-containing protein [Hibiscus syriacus]|uniref:Pentatricopeptide repeat-containing protein n=2 Tax=Hibiscus syriacus TaxID=106335 RepID=A0A6A3B0C8_HIBSY|nr:Pentatricopeptide repeat-containing protein [Hibiscus syriacus]